jgi:hypothetical protein
MSILDKDNEPLSDEEAMQRHISIALDVPEPSGMELELAYQVVKRLFNPLTAG